MMWINSIIVITVLVSADWLFVQGVEKDIEVNCLDNQATTITEGGVIANCAYLGLTRTPTLYGWLFELANVLQGVNVSHNHIKRLQVFPVLPRVLTVTLQHNSIKDIEPRAFTGLENLQNLDLSYNRISGESLKDVLVGKTSPDRIEPLPIRILFLSHNNISTINPQTFAHLRYLRDLHLDYNPLVADDDFFTALRTLPELKMLNLAGAELSFLPKDAFAGVQVTSLLLNGNSFTQVPDLGALASSLRLLNINQNPIEELDEHSFSGLNNLIEIVASGMPNLTKIKNGTFSSLGSIQVVSCSYNPQLVEVDEFAFWNHKLTKRSTLQEVYLNNNALPRIRKFLLPWIKMKKVTLDENKWVCDCRLHWLATLLKNRNNTIDRITELKCWEPIWLNGTKMAFWKMDTTSRYENLPCQEELEQERLFEEAEKKKILLKLEQEKNEEQKKEKERIEKEKNENVLLSSPESQPKEESSFKLYHFLIIAGIIALVILIVSLIAFNKYKNYRPIYHVEKMSSPSYNEMKLLKGTVAEKTQLVS